MPRVSSDIWTIFNRERRESADGVVVVGKEPFGVEELEVASWRDGEVD